MSEHRRTAIRRLAVSRYRSIASLDLTLPSTVVLYGPNGAGKSNILRAVQLVLRATTYPEDLPVGRERAQVLAPQDADRLLGLRADDFRYGDLPEIRVTLEVDLGTRARVIVQPPADRPLSQLTLEGVFQLAGDTGVRFWFERAEVDGHLQLGPPADHDARTRRRAVSAQRQQLAAQEAQRDALQQQLAGLDASRSPAHAAQRSNVRAALQNVQVQIQALNDQIRAHETSLGAEVFLAERIQRTLLPRLLQVSHAYRVPGGEGDPEAALYRAFLSDDRREREAAKRLSQRVARAGLFGAVESEVALFPVDSVTYGEQQVRASHPQHGDLALRGLGTGEQQLILMLGQRVITPSPIALIEEPEAHLHFRVMKRLADVLRDSVDGSPSLTPDVDQLWMATHHRLFAIAEKFLDVSLDETGATVARWRPRSEVAEHAWEPGPYWDSLRHLVESGLSPTTVVYTDESERPVTAKDILVSIQGDQELANKFVQSAMRAFLLSLAGGGEEAK